MADNQLVSEVPMYIANLMGQAREFPSLCCWCYVPETIHPTFMKTCPQSHPGFTCYGTLWLAIGQVRLGLVLLGLSIMTHEYHALFLPRSNLLRVWNLNPNPEVGWADGSYWQWNLLSKQVNYQEWSRPEANPAINGVGDVNPNNPEIKRTNQNPELAGVGCRVFFFAWHHHFKHPLIERKKENEIKTRHGMNLLMAHSNETNNLGGAGHNGPDSPVDGGRNVRNGHEHGRIVWWNILLWELLQLDNGLTDI